MSIEVATGGPMTAGPDSPNDAGSSNAVSPIAENSDDAGTLNGAG
jgi:hypothetical protein